MFVFLLSESAYENLGFSGILWHFTNFSISNSHGSYVQITGNDEGSHWNTEYFSGVSSQRLFSFP